MRYETETTVRKHLLRVEKAKQSSSRLAKLGRKLEIRFYQGGRTMVKSPGFKLRSQQNYAL